MSRRKKRDIFLCIYYEQQKEKHPNDLLKIIP